GIAGAVYRQALQLTIVFVAAAPDISSVNQSSAIGVQLYQEVVAAGEGEGITSGRGASECRLSRTGSSREIRRVVTAVHVGVVRFVDNDFDRRLEAAAAEECGVNQCGPSSVQLG